MPSLSLLEFLGIGFGVSFAISLNFVKKKPWRTGLFHKHLLCGAAGYFAGQWLENANNARQREKLIVLEDYVRLHPEDFPEEAPKKYGDVLLRWYPVR